MSRKRLPGFYIPFRQKDGQLDLLILVPFAGFAGCRPCLDGRPCLKSPVHSVREVHNVCRSVRRMPACEPHRICVIACYDRLVPHLLSLAAWQHHRSFHMTYSRYDDYSIVRSSILASGLTPCSTLSTRRVKHASGELLRYSTLERVAFQSVPRVAGS